MEKSVVGCGYPEACVLRVPGSPGYTVLSTARDIEEIVPTPELLEALKQDTLRRAMAIAQEKAPQTLLRMQEVNRTLAALTTDTNKEAIQAHRTALQTLVEMLSAEVEAWVYSQFSAPLAAMSENVEKISRDLRRAYVGAPAEEPEKEVTSP